MRYLKTLALFWYASVAAEMEYRLNFVMSMFSTLMVFVGALYVLSLLFIDTSSTLGGWSWAEALMVMAMFTMLDGLQATFMTPNQTQISAFVREGTLDFVLLKPMDSQFWLSARKVSIWEFPRVLVGLGLMIYAGVLMHVPAWQYLAGLLPLFFAAVVLYSLGYMLSTLCIWFVKLYNITIAMQSLLEAGRYPITAYPLAYRVFFTFILPVAFITTVPAQVVMNKGSYGLWLLGAGTIALITFAFSRWFWRYALKSYTSASS